MEHKGKVIFRADGNSTIGYGHVIRSLALAKMLNKEFECRFYIQQPNKFLQNEINSVVHQIEILPEEPNYYNEAKRLVSMELTGDELVVLDGYHFDQNYQQIIKNNGNSLIYIDDLAQEYFVVDAVINHADGMAPSDYLAEAYTQYYLGNKYALLRPPFLDKAMQPRRIQRVDSVLISMGGSQKETLTINILEACRGLDIQHIDVIGNKPQTYNELFTSLDYPSINFHFQISASKLAGLMSRNQIAICPASTLSLEACAVGMGLITGYFSNNQKNIYEGLLDNEMALGVGDFHMVDKNQWAETISKLVYNSDIIQNQVDHQKIKIDGFSPDRIRNRINLIGN